MLFENIVLKRHLEMKIHTKILPFLFNDFRSFVCDISFCVYPKTVLSLIIVICGF